MVHFAIAVIVLGASCASHDDHATRPPGWLLEFETSVARGELLERTYQLDELRGSHSLQWDVRRAEEKLAAARTTQERVAAQMQLATAQRKLAAWERERPELEEMKRKLERERAGADEAAERTYERHPVEAERSKGR